MIKNDDFYTEYLIYLNWRLSEGQINKGKFSLLKLSKSSFDDFKRKLENDEIFNNKIIQICKTEDRDNKIEKIIEYENYDENMDQLDDFFTDLDIPTSDKKIDDIFDDLDF